MSMNRKGHFSLLVLITTLLFGCDGSSSVGEVELQSLIASSTSVATTLYDVGAYNNDLTYDESNTLSGFESHVTLSIDFDTNQYLTSDATKISTQTNHQLLLITANDDATITLSGTYSGTILIVSTARVHLRLSGVSITATAGSALAIDSKKRTYVEAVEDTVNYLSDSISYASFGDYDMKGSLFSENKLILLGTGELIITSEAHHAIASDDGIVINDLDLVVSESGKDALHADDFIMINSGSLDLTAYKDGLQVNHGAIIINGGHIKIAAGDDGIISGIENDGKATVKITDEIYTLPGTIVFYGGHTEIIQSVEAVEAFGGLYVFGGTIEAIATDDGLNGVQGIVIAGGYVYAKASIGDGIDSNADITISGGHTVAVGGSFPEGSIDNDALGIHVSGGIFIGVGGSTSYTLEANVSQGFLVFGSGVVNQNFSLLDNDDVLIGYRATQSYSTLVVSHPSLQKNMTVDIARNGILASEIVFHGLYLLPTLTNYAVTSSYTMTSYVAHIGGNLGPEWVGH